MPQNTVSDPITDQEMAFAHLILSGTMNDRRAAKAVGLNPDAAANTKSKPRVHAYILERRAAVREKLVDQEAGLAQGVVEGLHRLNIGRDQILNRLWELATLSHEATRGSITGQMKAIAMIAAIEGLIPNRRSSSSQTQPVAPPVTASPQAPEPEPTPDRPSGLATGMSSLNLSRVPAAADSGCDAFLGAVNSLR